MVSNHGAQEELLSQEQRVTITSSVCSSKFCIGYDDISSFSCEARANSMLMSSEGRPMLVIARVLGLDVLWHVVFISQFYLR